MGTTINGKRLSVDDSERIARELLKPLIRYFNANNFLLAWDGKVAKDQEYHTEIEWFDRSNTMTFYKLYNIDDLDYCNDMTYIMDYKSTEYRVQFYLSPADCGYNSYYYQKHKDVYMLCEMETINKKNGMKTEMLFGFDIVKMSIVEIFDLYIVKPLNKEETISICLKNDLNFNPEEKIFLLFECDDIEKLEKRLVNTKLKGVLYNV